MKHRLITAEMADNLLQYLADNFAVRQYITCTDVERMLADTGLAFNELHALLDDFAQEGLIQEPNVRQIAVHLMVTQRLHKFLEAGGFSGELSKLKSELALLQAQLSGIADKQAQTVTTTINNVLSIIQSVGFGLLSKY
jgi:hypothetical protein